MIPPFDIFQLVVDEDPVLIASEQSLGTAMARVSVLREATPGDYLIVSRVTGKQILLTARGAVKRS